MTFTSSIYVIDVNLSTPSLLILDTRCGSRICTNAHDLIRSRELTRGEVDLRVGNRVRDVSCRDLWFDFSLVTYFETG